MTKIVGTLGPRSESVDVISALLKAGMSGLNFLIPFFEILIEFYRIWLEILKIMFLIVVARFDFSWGDVDTHRHTLENLKAAVKDSKKLCAVSNFLV